MSKAYRVLLEMPVELVGLVMTDIQERHKKVRLVEGGPVVAVQGSNAADPLLNYIAHHTGEQVDSATLKEIHIASGRSGTTAYTAIDGLVQAGFLKKIGRGKFEIPSLNAPGGKKSRRSRGGK